MRAMASDEYTSLNETLLHTLKSTFPALIIPPSSTAQLSALMELKSGVGGSESSLFLAELVRMYARVANTFRWRTSVITNDDVSGGWKDAVLEIKGAGAYDTLRWESGVHRVQRVPATEASGRTHTSTVAIVVSVLLILSKMKCIEPRTQGSSLA